MHRLGLLWLGALAACGPTGIEGFPCDFEGRCPGAYRCDLETATCVPGATCDAPLTDCSGDCTLLSSDTRHCGACERACASNESCVSGACVPDTTMGSCTFCPPGTECIDGACSCGGSGSLCGGALCVDLQQSYASCGTCFSTCTTAGTSCRAGACVCAPGEKVCGTDCIDVDGDPANCGACGRACPMGQQCEAGQCVTTCARNPQDACGDGRCWDVARDPRHCGAGCDACGSSQACVNGTCACPSGTTACGGACTDTRVDPEHCGTCGTACDVGEVCAAGACDCAPGLTRCGAECRRLADDPLHCGACGATCAPGQVCANGGCATACPFFMDACDDGACPDGRDPYRCGSCGSTCNPGELCVDGSCTRPGPALGCTSCPCDACTFPDGKLCCLRGGVPYCVDALRCPP